jgi:hypothetical protein
VGGQVAACEGNAAVGVGTGHHHGGADLGVLLVGGHGSYPVA